MAKLSLFEAAREAVAALNKARTAAENLYVAVEALEPFVTGERPPDYATPQPFLPWPGVCGLFGASADRLSEPSGPDGAAVLGLPVVGGACPRCGDTIATLAGILACPRCGAASRG